MKSLSTVNIWRFLGCRLTFVYYIYFAFLVPIADVPCQSPHSPLRHFVEKRKKLMLVDSVFNIIELLLNIFINIKLLADCQNSKISPKIYH